jgi:hypothetical protein
MIWQTIWVNHPVSVDSTALKQRAFMAIGVSMWVKQCHDFTIHDWEW